MKKHLIAAAALATLSTAALAQSSVTVYGIIDTGVFTTNNSGDKLRQTQVVSGTWLPSLWGFTGSEDLGGGLKAGFNLQSNLNSDNGSSLAATANSTALFAREATVNLSGSFGKLTLGQQIDNAFLQSVSNNAIFMHTGTLAVDGLFAYSKTNANAGTYGAFVSNAVGYDSPVINGAQIKLQHAQGETAGTSATGQYQSAVATYANGGLALSAGTAQYNDANSTSNALKKHLVSAKYTTGNLVLATQYHKYDLATTVNTTAYEIGVAYNVNAKTLVGVNYESFDDKVANNKPTVLSLKAKYALSKRTSVWGIAQQHNKEASTKIYQGYAAAISTATATKSATSFMSGITHSF